MTTRLRRLAAALTIATVLLTSGCADAEPDSPAAAPDRAADPVADPSPSAQETAPVRSEPTLDSLTDQAILYRARNHFGEGAVRAAYRQYGRWLLDTSVSEKMTRTALKQLTAAKLAGPLARMNSTAAADWRRFTARPQVRRHAANIHALIYWGFNEATPHGGGPVVVNKELKYPTFNLTTNGKLLFTATVKAELRSTKDGKPVRWPITRRHTLFLVPGGDGTWLVDGWRGTWDYEAPAIPDN